MSIWREEPLVPGTSENGWKSSEEKVLAEYHRGLVLENLGLGSRFVMSDYGLSREARVWDPETKSPKVVTYAYEDMPGTSWGKCEVDATPEVLEAYAAYTKAREEERRLEQATRSAKMVRRGVPVVVVRGRKVAKGTAGEVFWVGESNWGTRVGFKTATQEVVWVSAANVEVAPEFVAKRVAESLAEFAN